MDKIKSQYSIQKFGRFLSGMVMPNMGAFIVWGIIEALFSPTGWMPNENIEILAGRIMVYLLPLLIGYAGGKRVYGTRGGVLGSVATMGVIVGTNIPMVIGGMIMGPIGGWIIKKFDQIVEDKIPIGFEMLVNNISAGFIGIILILLGYKGIAPVVETMSNVFGAGIKAVVNVGLLPFVSFFIEPFKILFLNNAINYGVLSPLGIEEAAKVGKSIFFLIGTNPGPGLGILLAFWIYSKGSIKKSTLGQIIIHFFGGIHEIYFPYILIQPLLLLAVILGGASGVFIFEIFDAGLVAVPSPGSIFTVIAMTPKGGLLPVLLGIFISTVVTFLAASLVIKKKNRTDNKEIELKVEKSRVDRRSVKKIVVACDAGMGSSALGASILKNKIKRAEIDIEVINRSIDEIPADADIIITHEQLTASARRLVPKAEHISIDDFIMTSIYDELVERLKKNVEIHKTIKGVEREEEIVTLKQSSIRLGLKTVEKDEAIRMAGRLLFHAGYVEEEYIESMVRRDHELSTYIGNGTAIPHGASDTKSKIIKTGISILQFPDGVDFGEGIAYLVVGIAGVGDEHLMILSNLADIVKDKAKVEELRITTDFDYMYKQFTNQ